MLAIRIFEVLLEYKKMELIIQAFSLFSNQHTQREIKRKRHGKKARINKMLLSYCRSTSSSKGQETFCPYFSLPHLFVMCYTLLPDFPSSPCLILGLGSLCVCLFFTAGSDACTCAI